MIRYKMYDEESGETCVGIAESVLMLTHDDKTEELPEGRMAGRCNYFGALDKNGYMAETFVSSCLQTESRPMRMILMAIQKKMDDKGTQKKLMPYMFQDIQYFLSDMLVDEDDDEDEDEDDDIEEVEPLRETQGPVLDEFRKMMRENGFGDDE